ncbi:hypothetical protein G6O67_007124 [Ophiocordyceps sinensis]|uniref:Uncharacterized protein n=1 Tax=Ophiocordyceps sinensis TaxID=72228 RepID=A0A8H4LT67_9HYPO|nr:hypothetical protein G6O67_007124 [Ophiocordyceps sinensis]
MNIGSERKKERRSLRTAKSMQTSAPQPPRRNQKTGHLASLSTTMWNARLKTAERDLQSRACPFDSTSSSI